MLKTPFWEYTDHDVTDWESQPDGVLVLLNVI